MTRKIILKEHKAPPAKHFGDEVHTDLWGPSPINSLGGRRYYITFTDDATQFTVANVLRTKDKALNAYKTFAAWAQTQHGAKSKLFILIVAVNSPATTSPNSFSKKALSAASPPTIHLSTTA